MNAPRNARRVPRPLVMNDECLTAMRIEDIHVPVQLPHTNLQHAANQGLARGRVHRRPPRIIRFHIIHGTSARLALTAIKSEAAATLNDNERPRLGKRTLGCHPSGLLTINK